MKKILAIDDKKNNLFAIEEMINNLIPDCKVLIVQSGREGIEIAKTEQPDTILLDVVMPEMDGYEVCKKLKGDELTKHIPIVMITAIKTDTESRIKGLDVGADAFLSKPIDPAELIAQINVMLRIKQAEDKLRTEKELLDEKVKLRTKELRESEEKFRNIFDSAGDGILYVDKNAKVLDVNPAFCEITGIPKEDVVGRSGFNLAKKFINIKQLPQIINIIKSTIADKPIKRFELNFHKKILEITSKRKQNDEQIVGIIRDITERKRIESKLKYNKNMLRQIIDSTLNCIFVKDRNGMYLLVNKKMAELHKTTPEDLVGKYDYEIAQQWFETVDYKEFRKAEQNVIDNKKTLFVIEEPFEYQDGTERWFQTTKIPFDIEDNQNCILVISTDITERKQEEDKLRKSEEKFRAIIENTEAGYFFIDKDGIIQDVNESWVKMYKYKSKNEILGRHFGIIQNLEDIDEVNKFFNEIIKGYSRFSSGDLRRKCKDGSVGYHTFSARPVFQAGKVIGIEGIIIDTTRRNLAEERLKESEERLNLTIECANLGLWDQNFKTDRIFRNKQWINMLGFDLLEVISNFKSFENLIHPDDLPEVKKIINDHESGKTKTFEVEHRMKTKNGEWKWIKNLGKIIERDHYGKPLRALGIHLDISKQKLAEEKLKESEERYRSIYENMHIGIYRTTPRGEILMANPAIIALLKYNSFEELKTRNLEHNGYFLDNHRKKFKEEINKNKQIQGFESIWLSADGKKIYVRETAKAIYDINGNIKYYEGTVEDITEQKNAEQALRRHVQQLQERNEELDTFSHMVAHDLKNPLGTIMGFADFLYESYSELSKDEILNYLSIIIKDCKKTQQIINSLLLFASVRKVEINTEELNMGDIVAESITSLKPIIEKSKAEIILPDVWPIALGYAPWIEEVWTNYLSNAIKYGGTSPYIEIGTDTDNTENVPEGMVRFWIHDNGPGISADNQKLLFNKFERLDQVKTEGHGLGLSIVRRIIEKLGGQVGMESNKGSLFYFTLPYTGKAEENPTIINEVGGIKKDNKLSNLKVLIAEDEESADKHLSIVLNKISKEILHTKTGIETVDLCRINPDIDLILMDIRMPEMNGHEATRQIREFNKDIIIIAQTAYALLGDREKALKAGCNDYISKPIKKEELMEIIRKWF